MVVRGEHAPNEHDAGPNQRVQPLPRGHEGRADWREREHDRPRSTHDDNEVEGYVIRLSRLTSENEESAPGVRFELTT